MAEYDGVLEAAAEAAHRSVLQDMTTRENNMAWCSENWNLVDFSRFLKKICLKLILL